MSSPAAKSPYAGYRFPPEVISQAVWLYFRFPLSLRMVDEILAARGIKVSQRDGTAMGVSLPSILPRNSPSCSGHRSCTWVQ
jgi:hypothetical protein